MKINLLIPTALVVLVTFFACKKKDDEMETTPPTTTTPTTTSPTTIDPGSDPNFMIVAHTDEGFTATNRKVVVFGIPIYAYAEVEDEKLLHAANVLAQYLDNDEDGTVDSELVLTALQSQNAALFMWKTEAQVTLEAQDLGADETSPAWHTNKTGRFDASLEEVWHVITQRGFAIAHPDAFGEKVGTSSLTRAMDIARGGQFTSIPATYPSGAWYTYNDSTCNYECQSAEYIYWAMSSMLGAQVNRLDDISQEWTLNTPALVQSTDTAVYALLTDTQYKLPRVLPDGTYRR